MLRRVGEFLGLSDGFARIEDQAARIGVIDLGSNSIRLVAFDSATRSPATFFNEKSLCGLGRGLAETGKLSPAGKIRALAVLKRFAALAQRMDLNVLDAVATAAIRDAEDGPEFAAQIEEETGLQIRVATGADEARLAAQGVLIGEPNADGVVADIGGASMELTRLRDGEISGGVTTPLGPLRVGAEPNLGQVDAILADALKAPHGGPRYDRVGALYIVGGSWRCLINAHMRQVGYPMHVLQGFSLAPGAAREIAEWGALLSPEEIRTLARASSARAAVTPSASAVLARLIRALKPEKVVVSAFGLREGVLWEHLPPKLRAQDPLLQPCAAIERWAARRPGFGEELWKWLAPAFPSFSPADQRLARAACLLSDASWRTHPDYRARTTFELVTRNNFGGVDHADRVFIGAALLCRYKMSRKTLAREPVAALISPQRLQDAMALGRGMRLGGKLCAAAPGVLPHARLKLSEGELELRMNKRISGLDGEEMNKRLKSFASALGVENAVIHAER